MKQKKQNFSSTNKDRKVSIKKKPTITREELKDWFRAILEEEVPSKEKVIFHTGCITYGFVKHDTSKLFTPYCEDPNCGGCTHWRDSFNEAMREEAKKFLTDDSNF